MQKIRGRIRNFKTMLTGNTHRKNQADIFKAMSRPDFYPHAADKIEQRDTIISKVFLTGQFAYKIKKPVDLEYLDFTALDSRKHYCEQELILNQRLAPDIYLAVVPITFDNGQYQLDGSGTAIEYAVKMRQLSERLSMRNLMRRGKLDRESIDALALKLADFYQQGADDKKINIFGSWHTIWSNCEENFRQAEPFVGEIIDDHKFQIIRAATRAFMIRRIALFERRVEQQRIRDCHGDLRSGHIYFSDGIQIIDCIEFNDRFRYADVTSDLAFLAMDIDFEGHPETARKLINDYVDYTKDRELFILLDFYKCYRAWVRAKVNCFRLQQNNDADHDTPGRIRKAKRYVDLAYRYAVQFTRPTIWVICGLPASGKSTIAGELAKILKIVVLRSDAVRKALFGLDPEEPQIEAFEEGIYSKEVSSHTYAKLLLLAQEEVKKGGSVILDATYTSENQRDGVLCLAKDMDANIIFVECVAPYQTLKKRLIEREAAVALSDARLQHLKQFRSRFEPLAEIRDELHIRVDTNMPLSESIGQILAHDHFATSQQIGELMKNRLSEKV
ncbi:MAG: AAA family ATPase [Deltaproteobacteria bacterium]|nr:AAA family ATPase [Deltaproteobacteria bacterium]